MNYKAIQITFVVLMLLAISTMQALALSPASNLSSIPHQQRTDPEDETAYRKATVA